MSARLAKCSLLAAGLAGAALAPLSPAMAEDRPNPYLSDRIDSLIFGIYCAEEPVRVEEAPATASGVINLTDGIPEFRWQQLQVPADYGLGFGVVLTSVGGEVMDPVLVTVTHPPFPGSGIEVEQWISTINEGPNLNGFSFEYDFELVPGPWTFSASHDGEVLYAITFDVVPAALMPDLSVMCLGGAVS